MRCSSGLSPHYYVVDRIVEKTKWLLEYEDRPSTRSSPHRLSDQPYLTRYFKRNVGTKPGEFRRRRKNVQPTLASLYKTTNAASLNLSSVDEPGWRVASARPQASPGRKEGE